MSILKHLYSASATALATAMLAAPSAAQDLQTSGPWLSSDTFEQVDDNGVDLINGTFNIQVPALTAGGEKDGFVASLNWNGRSWQPNTPSIWTDGNRTLYVNNGLRVDEFDYQSGTGWVPVKADGSTLTCTFWDSDRKIMDRCGYVSHEGISISFSAPSPYAPVPENFSPALGNVNASSAFAFYPDGRSVNAVGGYQGNVMVYTNTGFGLSISSGVAPSATMSLHNSGLSNSTDPSIQVGTLATINISTPGLTYGDRATKHLLRPRNVTQTITDALNRTWHFVFDGYDIVSVRRPSSATPNLTLTYNDNHKVKTFSNGAGTWRYSYSSSGSNGTTTVLDPAGGTTVVTYVKKKGHARSYTDPLNRTTSYGYDANSRLTSVIYPEGNRVEYEYDARANITKQITYPKTSGTPQVVEAGYDATCVNRLTCNLPNYVIDAQLNRTDVTYNSRGQPETVTRPAATPGGVRPQSRMTYASMAVRVRKPDNSIFVNGYSLWKLTSASECNTLASCTGTADESKMTIDYGPLDTVNENYLWPIVTTASSGDNTLQSAVTRTYDARGNVVTENGPLPGAGDTTTNRYDAMRQLTGSVSPDPDGAGALLPVAVRNTYNLDGQITLAETGNVASASDPDWPGFAMWQQTATAYDAVGRPITVVTAGKDPITGTVSTLTAQQTAYDAFSRPTCVATRMDSARFPTIGSAGALSGGSLPVSACTFDTTGSATPDRIAQKVYDEAGQVIQDRRAVGTPLEQAYATYSYTPNGKQEFVIDANGNRAKLTWDGFDRQEYWYFPSKTRPLAFDGSTQADALRTAGSESSTDFEKYEYDANNNREWLTKRDGRKIKYEYDALNRVTKKDIPGSTAEDVYYGYDLRNHQLYARFASTTGQGVTNQYDALGRITSATDNMGGTGRQLQYQYDANGNRTRLTFPDAQYFTFAYDDLSRMKTVKQSGTTDVAGFTYNNRGERTGLSGGIASTYAYDAIGRLSSIAHDLGAPALNVTFGIPGYNPASQIMSRSISNDRYVNTDSSDVVRSYTTNGLNQYTSTASGGAALTYDANGNLTGNAGSSYTYDVENRLINASGASSLALSYDPLGRLSQTVGSSATTRYLYDGDALVAEYNPAGAIKSRYVHGSGVDEPVLWYEGSDLGVRCSLRADHQGSIVASTGSSTCAAVNRYDEWGTPSPANLGRFAYTGQAILPELGMYYYKARIYAPKLGRFLQIDPIGYEDQLNLYLYAGNDPGNSTDPNGERRKNISIPYVRRDGWSRIKPNYEKMVRATGPYTSITLHHTGSHKTPESVESLHRGEQNSYLRKISASFGIAQVYEYDDIGYNFLISESGIVYQGRSLSYVGAHVSGRNNNNIGIAMLGDYSNSAMSPMQYRSLSNLLSILSRNNPIKSISTHGDYDSKKLGELRGASAQISHIKFNLMMIPGSSMSIWGK